MGRVRDELPPHPLLLLERGGHLVERVRQADELLGALARDPGLVIALGDAAGRAADLAERASQHRAEHARHGDRDDDREDRCRDDHPADAVLEHRLTGFGALAVFGHEVGEALAADDDHTDRQDDDREAGDDEGRQRDSGGDSAGSQRHVGSPSAPVGVGAARYPTPRTVAT